MEHTYQLSGMTCKSYKASAEESLSNLEQLKAASIDLEAYAATITMTPHIELDTLQKAVILLFKTVSL